MKVVMKVDKMNENVCFSSANQAVAAANVYSETAEVALTI